VGCGDPVPNRDEITCIHTKTLVSNTTPPPR
jgi:hypothetical protein